MSEAPSTISGACSPEQRSEQGRAARARVPRSAHGGWSAPAGRPDPIAMLEQQACTRVPELLPIRYGRMAASPFAYFRGAAAVMANDLAATPTSGAQVQLCGDAHLSNFGGFASPERELVFDLNDFDETHTGPWEWDLKRLVASVEIAGRSCGFSRAAATTAVRATAREYRLAMRDFAAMSNLEVWYARMEQGSLAGLLGEEVGARQRRVLRRTAAKARRRDNARAFERLTHEVDGVPRIVNDPPLVVRIADLLSPSAARDFSEQIGSLIETYRDTLQGDRRHLLDGYRVVDIARKVVGVGSVGTRAWVILLLGRDGGDPLFLQCKEAQASVLEPILGPSRFANHGQRVVEGQRLMQASSDILLGWLHVSGVEDVSRDYYVRQLWDWKASADVESMVPEGMLHYGRMCGWTLARGHARSGDPIEIAGYLGSGEVVDRALGDFASTYAEQNERDYEALLAAIADGGIEAEPDR